MNQFRPVAQDGSLILYANKDRSLGKLYDKLRDIWSDEKPLQVFFKWGNFEGLNQTENAYSN